MWIKRTLSEHILNAAQESPALVLTGARQTGKTSLLRDLFPNAAYVSLDDPLDAAEAAQNPAQFLEKLSTPVIIDEVQYAPELFRYLKLAIDKNRNTNSRYFLTGSQRFEMMQGISDSLAGRIRVLDLLTLSTSEIETASGKTAEGTQLLSGIVSGGYPEIHAKGIAASRFFRSYVATYVERDVRQLVKVKSAQDFGRFMRLVAARTGQLVSATAIASDLGLSAPTVREWLSVLQASQIVSLVEPWFGNATNRLVKANKLYFLDTGLCCHLLNIESPNQLLRSPHLGALFETHAFSQLQKHISNNDLSNKIYFFRDHDGHEIDFVVPQGSRFHLIECKWSENPKYESRNFDAFLKRFGEDSILSKSLCCSRRGMRKLDDYIICDAVNWGYLFE